MSYLRYLIFSLLFISLYGSEESATRQVFAHLKVHDPQSAVDIGRKFLELHPDSQSLRLAYIQALADVGDEAAVFREWSCRRDVFEKDRNALEILAWSVLKKGELSPQMHIHLSSLIGASLTRDVRAIPMLVAAMRSSNAFFRLFGIRFAGQLGDGVLQEELARLLDEEPVWFVRQEVIQAVGQLRVMELKPKLVKIVSDSKGMAEERVQAILALVQLYDGVRKDDLQKLCTSSRSGLRELACELVGHYDLRAESGRLRKMLKDSSPDVRAHALRILGLLGESVGTETLNLLAQDTHPAVAITAAWVMCRQGDAEAKEKGLESMKQWLLTIHPRWRWTAASQLASCGPQALPLIKKQIKSHEDRFVRANLALGVLGQRALVEEASLALDAFLQDPETGRLMWEESSPMRMIVPSRAYHIEQVQNYPKMVDQLARLDLLNMLCILKYPKAQETAVNFIKKESWGVTGAAVAVLLQEGDEEALSVIGQLLKDSDPQTRVQAALMLALYGSDEAAVTVLHEAYPHVNRDTKIQILEAIGHVGTQESIPFLVDILGEPFQLMRVIAASAIIQCLYH